MENIHKYNYLVNKKIREKRNGHKAKLIWFTGLSGSGKSTVANACEQEIFQKGINTYVLDGDNIRTGINKGLGFSREDREENLRRIAEISKLFLDTGMLVFAAFVSPLKSDREKVKSIVGNDNFIEIFVNTPLEICEQRDVKGLYKKAREGKINNFTGISAPYEAPDSPDLEIKTNKEPLEDSINSVINLILPKIKL